MSMQRLLLVDDEEPVIDIGRQMLRQLGYKVTVLEALPVAGGMMRVGIPAFRLPRERLAREIDQILRGDEEVMRGDLFAYDPAGRPDRVQPDPESQ